jgi:hypothetical protein
MNPIPSSRLARLTLLVAMVTLPVLLTTSPVAAQVALPSAPLVSDRPDFTESPLSVPAGMLQLEGGLSYATSSTFNTLAAGELLVRYGLLDRLELRFGIPSLLSMDDPGDTTGFSDASVGVKYQLGPSRSGWDIAVIGALSLPSGHDAFTSDRLDPSALVTAGRAINERVSMTGQIRGSIVGQGNDSILESSLSTGFGLTTGLNGFVEALARFQDGIDTGLQVNLGVTSLIRPSFQLDVYSGFGLTDTMPDFLIGAGFVIRR